MAFLRRRARPGRAGGSGGGAGRFLPGLLCLLLVLAPAVAGGRLDEVEIRAGFVYNFARFAEWPPGALGPAERPFVIAVLGDPELARALAEGLSGRRLRGRPVVVREARRPGELGEAQVAWIGPGWEERLGEVLGRIGDRPVLTVSEIPGFAGRGGIIELYRLGTKFRFAIDERAAARRGLRLSSKLLALARPRPAGGRGGGR